MAHKVLNEIIDSWIIRDFSKFEVENIPDQYYDFTAKINITDKDLLERFQKEIDSYQYPGITIDAPKLYSTHYYFIQAYHQQVKDTTNITLPRTDVSMYEPSKLVINVLNLPEHYNYALLTQKTLPVIPFERYHYRIYEDGRIIRVK